MTEFLSIAILPVALTLTAFLLGQKIQKKLKSPILNPILISDLPFPYRNACY